MADNTLHKTCPPSCADRGGRCGVSRRDAHLHTRRHTRRVSRAACTLTRSGGRGNGVSRGVTVSVISALTLPYLIPCSVADTRKRVTGPCRRAENTARRTATGNSDGSISHTLYKQDSPSRRTPRSFCKYKSGKTQARLQPYIASNAVDPFARHPHTPAQTHADPNERPAHREWNG